MAIGLKHFLSLSILLTFSTHAASTSEESRIKLLQLTSNIAKEYVKRSRGSPKFEDYEWVMQYIAAEKLTQNLNQVAMRLGDEELTYTLFRGDLMMVLRALKSRVSADDLNSAITCSFRDGIDSISRLTGVRDPTFDGTLNEKCGYIPTATGTLKALISSSTDAAKSAIKALATAAERVVTANRKAEIATKNAEIAAKNAEIAAKNAVAAENAPNSTTAAEAAEKAKKAARAAKNASTVGAAGAAGAATVGHSGLVGLVGLVSLGAVASAAADDDTPISASTQ